MSDPIHVRVPIADENGNVTVEYVFSEEDARTVVGWPPSVARLYLGHYTGPDVQYAVKMALGPLRPPGAGLFLASGSTFQRPAGSPQGPRPRFTIKRVAPQVRTRHRRVSLAP